MDQSREQVNHNDEAHGETAETAKLVQENKLAQVVHSGVDPATTLRKQNLPVVGSHRIRVRIANELRLEQREVLEKECREVTIFSEMQQILHMQRIDAIFRVVVDELVGDEERLVRIRGAETIEGEATGQASDGTEEGLEGLGQVVRNVVLVHLYSYEIVLTEAWKFCLPGSSSTTILPRSQAWFHHRYR